MTVASVGQATIKIMSPEEIAARAGGTLTRLRLPDAATLFAERAMRLRQLAAGHAMQDYLVFMSELALAQQQVLNNLMGQSLPLPDGQALQAAQRAQMPPLPAADWPRDPAWQWALRQLAGVLGPKAPVPAQTSLAAIAGAEGEWMERQADCLLNGVMLGLDLAAAPVVAAALQCYWTALVLKAQRLHGKPEEVFAPIADETTCPCCGSRPTASVTRRVGDVDGQRYLHCSLCACEWHMVRIQCPHCLSGKGLAYQSLQALTAESAGKAVVQAETCDDCHHYLKIVHSEHDPLVEPAADDLASITLDLLVSETGMQRHGLNLMLLFGDPDAPPDPGGSP